MASKYLLVLLIGVAALITPSLGHFRKPSHHDYISPAPAPAEHEPEPPMPLHKPHPHEPHPGHKHHKKEKPEPLVPAEPPSEGFFPPTYKPLPPPFHIPAYPPKEKGEGVAPYMPPSRGHHHHIPYNKAPPPIHAY